MASLTSLDIAGRLHPIPVSGLAELYADRSLYSSPDMFSPPSERLSHVLRFELTTGCNWNACTYCHGYNGIKHTIKTGEDYRIHVDKAFARIGRHTGPASKIRRIFIGGGNALAVDTNELVDAISHTANQFYEFTAYWPRRIALYGRTESILKQGSQGLQRISEAGRRSQFYSHSLIYWGVESGSDNVLKYCRKGCARADMEKAASIVNNAKTQTSVMIMPGLGGIKFYGEHIRDTAQLLGAIQPHFITFMGVNAAPRSAYALRMREESAAGSNRPLTPAETAKQMISIIDEMPLFSTKVGCFDPEIDAVGSNPQPFGSVNIDSKPDKDGLVGRLLVPWLREDVRRLEEKLRALEGK